VLCIYNLLHRLNQLQTATGLGRDQVTKINGRLYMEFKEFVTFFEDYNLWLVVLGMALLGTTVFPRLLTRYPFSMPIPLVAIGYAVVALPFGLEAPDLMVHGDIVEHLTELGVIIAIMGAGLKIDRIPSFKGWMVTWRLLGITMLLTIVLAAFLGWWLAAFVPATAVLLGAVAAPTDPVLASEVEVGAPGDGSKDAKIDEKPSVSREEEDELRFALTSEAGLNDGLAFPFTNMAIAMVFAGALPQNWFGNWLLANVFYEIVAAVGIGIGLGYLLARLLVSIPSETIYARYIAGLGALAATLIIYGTTEYLGGYGFIATFVGAVTIRQYERGHHYHKPMHILIEKAQRVFIAVILVGLGAAIAGGLLGPLTWELVLVATLLLFVVRPLCGMIGLIGHKNSFWQERLAISFLGIRGIGSLYYLSYALNKEDFAGAEQLWALVGFVVLVSVFVHGITVTPIMEKVDNMRNKRNGK
jgi:NhaP-type Na+/H+ or K+/H+ antiporter